MLDLLTGVDAGPYYNMQAPRRRNKDKGRLQPCYSLFESRSANLTTAHLTCLHAPTLNVWLYRSLIEKQNFSTSSVIRWSA